MKLIKFLGLLSILIIQANTNCAAKVNLKSMVESDGKHLDENVFVIYNSMKNEIFKLIGKKNFCHPLNEDELREIIHIIIAKVDYVYGKNLPKKKDFLTTVCYLLDTNFDAFFKLYIHSKKESEECAVGSFVHQYLYDDEFFRKIVYQEKCLGIIRRIITYENRIRLKYYDQNNAKLYQEKHGKETPLKELHKYLKEHYLKFIKSLANKNDSAVLNFLANYASGELLDAVLN